MSNALPTIIQTTLPANKTRLFFVYCVVSSAVAIRFGALWLKLAFSF